MDILHRLEKEREGKLVYEGGEQVEDQGGGFEIVEQGRQMGTRRRNRMAKNDGYEDNEEEMKFQRLCMSARPEVNVRSKKKKRAAKSRVHSEGPLDDGKNCITEMDEMLAQFDSRAKEAIKESDGQVFNSLYQLAERSRDGARQGVGLGTHPIPTGLIRSGGVNSADHSHMFPELKEYLVSKGCKVALISSLAFSKKAGSSLVSRILMQFCAEDSEQQSFDLYCIQDLVVWYAELKKSLEKNELQKEGCDGVLMPPIVIIIESLETAHSKMLQDLICCLSEVYSQFPVTLMMGITTSHVALNDSISYSVIDKAMECHHFEMASAMQRVEAFVDNVLLGSWYGFLFDLSTIHTLWDSFLLHHFAISIIVHGMKLAMGRTWLHHPVPKLLSSTFRDRQEVSEFIEKKLTNEDKTQLQALYPILYENKSSPPMALEEAIFKMMEGWDEWRVAIKWLVEAARSCGLHAGFSSWELYRDAQHDAFDVARTLEKIRAPLMHLSDDAREDLVLRLGARLSAIQSESTWCPGYPSQTMQKIKNAILTQQQQQQQQKKSLSQAKAAAVVLEPVPESSIDSQASCRVQKREKYYNRSARRAALMSRTAKSNKKIEIIPDTAVEWARDSSWVEYLMEFLKKALSARPLGMPESAMFLCKLGPISSKLTTSTRVRIHQSLKEPHRFYPLDIMSSCSVPPMEDTCIAYQLLDDDPTNLNLVDWFLAFEEVTQEEGNKKRSKDHQKSSSKLSNETMGRFSQSLQDLQYIGLIQASRKKRGDHAQRNIYMPLQF